MIQIIEVLDYGMSLLNNGNILKADGTVITKQEYEEAQQAKLRNKLDWVEVHVEEAIRLLETAIFATKTYDTEEQSQGMSISKKGFAFVDPEGYPYYMRTNEFSGSEKYEITEVTWSKFIYNVDRNSSDEASKALEDIVQNLFGVEEQVGSIFSPDQETEYLIKKFVKDNHVWSMIFRNGKLSNIKQGEALHCEVKVQPKQSKLSDALNTDRFSNMY